MQKKTFLIEYIPVGHPKVKSWLGSSSPWVAPPEKYSDHLTACSAGVLSVPASVMAYGFAIVYSIRHVWIAVGVDGGGRERRKGDLHSATPIPLLIFDHLSPP